MGKFYLIIFAAGMLIGSFLNVCIYRIPEGENIVFGRSRCRSCKEVLKWYELIPVVSFLCQGGKCRHCKEKISIQYPLVELAGGLICVWVVVVCGWTWESLLYCVCSSTLLVVGIIDERTFEIPPGCNILIGILGGVHLLLDITHWQDYVTGMFIVSGLFLITYFLTGKKGIGGGDIKLMAAAGLLLGWQKILLALFIGSVAGMVIHLALMKIRGRSRVLAFGPYLAAGIFAAMLYGDVIFMWYFRFCV